MGFCASFGLQSVDWHVDIKKACVCRMGSCMRRRALPPAPAPLKGLLLGTTALLFVDSICRWGGANAHLCWFWYWFALSSLCSSLFYGPNDTSVLAAFFFPQEYRHRPSLLILKSLPRVLGSTVSVEVGMFVYSLRWKTWSCEPSVECSLGWEHNCDTLELCSYSDCDQCSCERGRWRSVANSGLMFCLLTTLAMFVKCFLSVAL